MFNPQHLLKAFNLYDSQFDRWSWGQRDLFWRQVLGFTQRFLPANKAMDFAQDLHTQVQYKQKSQRSFKFRFEEGAIFPPAFDSFSGLGMNMRSAEEVGCCLVLRCGQGRILERGDIVFKTYVE